MAKNQRRRRAPARKASVKHPHAGTVPGWEPSATGPIAAAIARFHRGELKPDPLRVPDLVAGRSGHLFMPGTPEQLSPPVNRRDTRVNTTAELAALSRHAHAWEETRLALGQLSTAHAAWVAEAKDYVLRTGLPFGTSRAVEKIELVLAELTSEGPFEDMQPLLPADAGAPKSTGRPQCDRDRDAIIAALICVPITRGDRVDLPGSPYAYDPAEIAETLTHRYRIKTSTRIVSTAIGHIRQADRGRAARDQWLPHFTGVGRGQAQRQARLRRREKP